MRKKNRARRPGLGSRFALARALRVSLTSVDRLIAAGLKPAGHRGHAKLYALAAARALVRGEKSHAESRNLIALVDAKACRVRNDLRCLRDRYVDPADVVEQWSRRDR